MSQAVAKVLSPEGAPRGTAFAISGDLALTAFHCIGDRVLGEISLPTVSLQFLDGPTLIASYHDGNRRLDFALLKLKSYLPDALEPIPIATEVEPHESFRCIGYPAAVRGPDYVTIGGEVRNPAGSLFEGVPAIQLYCPEAAASASLELPGMSGGPVLVGKDPEVVVGIIRWNPQHPDGTAQAQGGMVFACPIKNVLEELPALEVHAVRRVRPKAPSAPQVLQPWLRRPGAPRFHMHPGINLPRQLLNRFEMQADVTPADMQARWVGPGINMDFVAPMRQNTPNQYRMKGVQMEPEGTEDTVTFEVRFWLEDGEHGGRWKWPVLKHSKGHWEFHTELGSGVNQPKPEDTW